MFQHLGIFWIWDVKVCKVVDYSTYLEFLYENMISEIKSATEIHVSSKISTTHVKSTAIVKSTVVKKPTYLKILIYF